MSETSAIYVFPDAWAEASDADRDAYERKARDLGITLYVQPTGSGGREEVVLEQDGDLLPTSYKSAVACRGGRQPWEHVVRRELRFDDPCFS